MTPETLVFLIPGDLETRTGGYAYDRRIRDGLRGLGWNVDVQSLKGSFPQPPASALAHADAMLAAIPSGRRVLIDGLALGAMPVEAARHATRLRLMGLVHHPLALETGIDAGTAARLHDSERRALAAVRHVVVTSARTVSALAALDVPASRVTVVEPGTDAAPLAKGSQTGDVRLVCVASLSPRKGHAILFRALGRLRSHRWHLDCVGSADRNPETGAVLRQLLREEQLEDRVSLVGEADASDVGVYYDRSDVFVLPTLYEGYGMVVAEALARGLPVISTPTGAIADLVTSDVGMLVPPGDVDGWCDALQMIFDARVRARLATGARARRTRLRNWDAASAEMAEALVRHG
jgi:glycosyltransferase involved in cell wall biosynthesis